MIDFSESNFLVEDLFMLLLLVLLEFSIELLRFYFYSPN